MRASRELIDKLVRSKNVGRLLDLHKGYLRKYRALLSGHIPDSSLDTRQFIESISDLDIASLIMAYEELSIDIDKILIIIMKSAISQALNAEDLHFKFRNLLSRWIHNCITEVY